MADGSMDAKAPAVSRTGVSAIGGMVPFSFALIGMSFVGGLLDVRGRLLLGISGEVLFDFPPLVRLTAGLG